MAHPLKTWLTENGKTASDLAAALGVDDSTVSRYIGGERTPRPRHMAGIVKFTGGNVTANDFLPEADDPDTVNGKSESRSAA